MRKKLDKLNNHLMGYWMSEQKHWHSNMSVDKNRLWMEKSTTDVFCYTFYKTW